MVFGFLQKWRARTRAIQEFQSPQREDKEYPWLADEAMKAAQVKLGQGDTEGALMQWQIVRTRFPDRKIAFLDPIAVLLRLRRLDEAERLIMEGAVKFPDESRFPAGLAQLAKLGGDTELALQRWREVREKFPTYMAGYVVAADDLLKLGRVDEAEAMVKQGLERFPRGLRLLITQAQIVQTHGQWEEALTQWQAIHEGFPPRSDVLLGVVNCLRKLGREDEIEDVLGEIRRYFPEHLPTAIDHARCAERRDDWLEASLRWGWIRDRFPQDARGYLGCARALRQQARLDEADAVLAGAIQRLPRNTALLFEHARVAHQNRDWSEAARRWALVLQQAPDNAEAQRRSTDALNKLSPVPSEVASEPA